MPRWPVNGRKGAKLIALILAAGGLVGLAGCDLNENADVERGRQLFTAKCGGCHALAQAGTTAPVGPDLDAAFAEARANGMDNDTVEGVVQSQIANPREVEEGAPDYDKVFMPSDLVTGQDAEDVAAYVASVAGVPGAKPPELTPAELFVDRCGSCHTLGAAGTSATTGPDLDDVLPGKTAAYIEKAIVNPDAEIAAGFSAGVMPPDFGQSLTPQDLKGLVKYLLDNVGKSQ